MSAAERAAVEAEIAKMPNKNRPLDYRWMEALISMIALNTAPTVTDLSSSAQGAPLFVMAGACPSVFAGMQAVVFTHMAQPTKGVEHVVDYWWLKPKAEDPSHLEPQTMHRHGKGTYKNDPGASKKVYGPIATLFSSAQASGDGKLRFGILSAPGGNGGTPRAYIDCVSSGARYFLAWVWQEDWSSPVSFGKKFMKGKVIYQKGEPKGPFFARPFRFVEGTLMLPAGEQLEETLSGVLGSDRIKLGCVV